MYTPSTDEIRDAWAGARGGYENEPRYREREAQFDRWFATLGGVKADPGGSESSPSSPTEPEQEQ